MRIDMRHLRAFLAVAELLHFRQAAERLNLAQPALSRTIQQLEEAIGVPLLTRNNRQVEITEPGRIFLDECKKLMAQLDLAIINTRRASQGEVGRLSIGYTDFAITGKLPTILEEFKSLYPEIKINLLFGSTEEQLALLNDGRIDVAFMTGPNRSPGLTSIIIQRDRFIAAVSNHHPLARRSEIELKELAEEPFIVGSMERWKHFRRHLDVLCMTAGFMPRISQETFNSEGIFGFVAANFGVTIHLECANNYIRKGVTTLSIKDANSFLETEAVWLTDTTTPTQRVFSNFIQSYGI
ncbi:LysR family transcriptional regulator [Halomonas heilongjiangensis]|uniref:LysR family transcriptional regulator n=1 Tax=Halomonas heilongjiangensis TaxID=1387883 RepID=A0A2N7TGP0_9GAMM|nr:LysR substrate-binding domain-containing protein [Halomonas heilongjiangensis]PMR67351.1 LysR family transcriptional regulator [Halomonas heilongjiangensis]PXX88127.1 LysR family transcriptional regulator [Halomonas heilongjiangensis]